MHLSLSTIAGKCALSLLAIRFSPFAMGCWQVAASRLAGFFLLDTVIPSGAGLPLADAAEESAVRRNGTGSRIPKPKLEIKTAMTLLEHLRRQFDYEFWANREEIGVLSQLSDPPASALRLLSHVIAAEVLWLDRLQQTPPRLAVWPDLSLTDCNAKLQETEREWRGYLAMVTDETLVSRCAYKNSKGEVFENTVSDVLAHLLFHSAYHRGQIAQEVRRLGQTPAYTDYIHAVRQGIVQ